MFKRLSTEEIVRNDRQNGLLQIGQQIEDTNDVAEMTVLNAMDKDDIAEMLLYALHRIDELEEMING
ncbi:MAG TPA: hypothetical protein VFC79_02445 [Tissierellaceae bacterium]|nr:hypothetical protein [Tissierellaceae bacterium]